MGRVAIAAVAAVLLLTATGCGERSEPIGANVRLYPVTVQTGDRPLRVTAPKHRIAALDRPVEEIVRALGAGSRIVARTGEVRIDFQALRRARPDLIAASADANERDLSKAAAVTKAEVYTAPGDSIRQVERAITQLGLLTGTPVRARALVRRIEQRRHEVDARLARTSEVSVFVDTGFLTTVTDQSLIGDVIREAHGRNVAGSRAEAGPVDAAELSQFDPDVYVVLSDAEVTLADLRRNPATRRLRAVREGQVVVADAALLQPGPRIGDGLRQIAHLLHPDAVR
ncbi:MAG TPA: ABC transporter substrate-binding protein [Gaiellaceae bacterium]|nr:ABC transporter substrate-binding protein [Gaiellaceae bacterium]